MENMELISPYIGMVEVQLWLVFIHIIIACILVLMR